MERTAAGIPTAESAACSLAPFRAASRDDSISGPLYDNDGQMEVQSADREIALGLSNHAWIEPASSVQKMPCRLQNEQSRGTCIAPDLDGMEVESPPDLDLSRRLAEPASFLTSGKSSKNRS
ncbi:probable RNA-dependent RNA polymerase 4 [Panicum hallii]|uniref:probable RNA-dependent RNA polymerase 4 n=1 Tax=Panicum hallii TaxID=206008 RepID=UPI000DF4F04B|nr:probable RNA-dependent RNA polymerase 4 [Panicum hallii]